MRILFASDSFKGSLTSEQTAKLLGKAAEEVFGECVCSAVPVADGGEGTTDAVVRAMGGEMHHVKVHGPLMEEAEASYGCFGAGRAVIEMAQASGLPMVPEEKRNPLYTTTYGTGEMILDALERGYRDLSIAIGGSATNDGGMGAMCALGIRFLDADGNVLEGKGENLGRVETIDLTGLDPRIKETKITVMCDVTNPLTGKDGATYTFGGQKGGTPGILDALEQGMLHYKEVICRTCGTDPDTITGSGAAGGLGAALVVFLNGEMRSGIDTVLDLIGFDDRLNDVDLVVTGEGRTDWQSCFGKVMQGIGLRAKAKGIPAVGLSGSLGEGAEKIFEHGIESLITSVDAPMQLAEAMERSKELYYSAAVRMFRFVRVGMEIRTS